MRPSRMKPAAAKATVRAASTAAPEAAETMAVPFGMAPSEPMAVPPEERTIWTTWSETTFEMPGTAASAEVVRVVSTVKRVEPSTATPSAEPTWRAVYWMPEACPESLTGTSTRITPVNWAVAMPTPIP